VATIDAEAPDVCVVDSVQTLHAEGLTGAPGTVGQVREVAGRIARVAKERGVATILVGHVTKEGSLAGPRVLEHLVDCVLQFEGERERAYRTVRALKNRFGSTNEVGVFEMRETGLVEVVDASARFVSEATRAPGSVVLCAMEGSRPLLVEVQALVAPSELVPPRRVASGIDRNRLALLLAVLARHAGIGLGSSDVFVSAAGGVRVEEPGADLPIALALASAAKGVVLGARPSAERARAEPRVGVEAVGGDRPRLAGARPEAPSAPRPLAAFGEIGLTGELRYVAHPERRVAEAAKFGLDPVLSPEGAVRTLRAAVSVALSGAPRAPVRAA
jgi:DNA repair protein RadA/Sms